MTIISLMGYIALVALFLTALIYWKKGGISIIDSFLQNFCGSLFIFSGFVKAVDPVGTAYKMEQYFQQFESVAAGTWAKFCAPLFPWMADHAISFSVIMIVLEIVVGIMLLLGFLRKWNSWLFFLILIFFTVLTGFTYLTGYVPDGVNFFEFGKWAEYSKNNMKVTDCGCFGDFIKLEPKISFFKDIILLIPGIWFLFRWSKQHQLFSPSLRSSLAGFGTIATLMFCLSNFIWDEPIIDFRPFKNGADIRAQKSAEKKAAANVKMSFKLKNKQTGKIEILEEANYMKNFAAYPKTEWEVVEQIKSEPEIPETKISYFDIADLNGEDKTDSLLLDVNQTYYIISPKVKYSVKPQVKILEDSTFAFDTIYSDQSKAQFNIVKTFKGLSKREVKSNEYIFDQDYIDIFEKKLIPLIDSTRGPKCGVAVVIGGMGEEGIASLREKLNVPYQYFTCDDIVLKTIMRSNPGLLLMHFGKIEHKWHHNNLPTVEELKEKYIIR